MTCLTRACDGKEGKRLVSILEVSDLAVEFNTIEGVVHAVNGVSFSLDSRETLGIVGESGSGKSVSMMSLLRLIPEPPGRIRSGSAWFDSSKGRVDLLSLSKTKRAAVRGRDIGFVFQDPMSSLNPLMTVGEQIAESMRLHLELGDREARTRTVELLDRVGIPAAAERYGNYPHQFSGGMRQRVMIAIAIACGPKLLIADEPTTALDVTVQAQILDLVKSLRDELGLAVIWISHDLGVVAGLADRVIVMYGGLVAECASVDELYEQPRHPYTEGLLEALPRVDQDRGEELRSIEGTPPDLYTAPGACPFAPRCSYTFDRCRREVPPRYVVNNGHDTACFYDLAERRPRSE